MRATLLTVAALALLRIVVGMHFFLEGLSHLRDPDWSSAGFRRAAVGPLADWYRSDLPQTGDWNGTLGRADGRDVADAADAWKRSVRDGWDAALAARGAAVQFSAEQQAAARQALDAATSALDDLVASWGDDLVDYRLQIGRLRAAEALPSSSQIPYARDRVSKQRRELSGKQAGWMREAEALGNKLTADWDAGLSRAQAARVAAATPPGRLWRNDRFVAWSLVTIGAALVVGFLVKFHAMGGVFFLASVVASQPFWVSGAAATYDQWVELAALLVIACMPVGGWSGLDYFLRTCCPWRRGRTTTEVRG